MDLHGYASGAVGVVNPFIIGSIQVSTGNAQNPNGDGTLIPTYRNVPQVSMQVQALDIRTIRQIDGLNLSGVERMIYIRGRIDGLVRPANKGGDLINLPDGTVWLVVTVLEAWPDWCKVGVALQNNS